MSSSVSVTGNFNCRDSNWYLEDTVTPHEARVKALTIFFGFHQVIRPVYNGASVAICPYVCALVAVFLNTLKRLSNSFFTQN